MSCSSPKNHIQIQIIFPGLWHKVPGEVLNFDKLTSIFVYEWKGLEQATGRNGGQEIDTCFVGRILLVLGDTRLWLVAWESSGMQVCILWRGRTALGWWGYSGRFSRAVFLWQSEWGHIGMSWDSRKFQDYGKSLWKRLWYYNRKGDQCGRERFQIWGLQCYSTFYYHDAINTWQHNLSDTLMVGRSQRGKKGLEARFKLQSHTPSDLFPPTRPHLLKFL